MSELENSLTDIGWLNQKLVIPKPPKEFDSISENTVEETALFHIRQETTSGCPQSPAARSVAISCKPVLSYANLIIQAMKSTAGQMMTLNDIYNWIMDAYPYFQQATNGWKNSIRHNLSLNKCFVKIKRPKDDRGKGSYWTFDTSYLDENGYLKAKSRSRPHSQGRLSPYANSMSPSSAFSDNVVPYSSSTSAEIILQNMQSPERETIPAMFQSAGMFNSQPAQPIMLLECHLSNQMNEQMKLQDHRQFQYDPSDSDARQKSAVSIESDNQLLSTAKNTGLGNIILHPSFYNSNLSDSFKKLYKAIFEKNDDELLSSDCIRNYESLKNSVKLASSTKWDRIDLTRFPGLLESIDVAASSNWQLNHDQVLDLAASLNGFYSSFIRLKEPLNVGEGNSPVDDLSFPKDPLLSKCFINSAALISSPLPTATEQTTCPFGLDSPHVDDYEYEIEDDFNWDSLLSS